MMLRLDSYPLESPGLPVPVWESIFVLLSSHALKWLACINHTFYNLIKPELLLRKKELEHIDLFRSLLEDFLSEWTLERLIAFLQRTNQSFLVLLQSPFRRFSDTVADLRQNTTDSALRSLCSPQSTWVAKCKSSWFLRFAPPPQTEEVCVGLVSLLEASRSLKYPIAEHCIYVASLSLATLNKNAPPSVIDLLLSLLFHPQEFQRKGAARALIDLHLNQLPSEQLLDRISTDHNIKEAVAVLSSYGNADRVLDVLVSSITAANVQSLVSRCSIIKGFAVMGRVSASTEQVMGSIELLLDLTATASDPNFWLLTVLEAIRILDYCTPIVAEKIRLVVESDAQISGCEASRSATVDSLQGFNFRPPEARSSKEICFNQVLRGARKKCAWFSLGTFLLCILLVLLIFFSVLYPSIALFERAKPTRALVNEITTFIDLAINLNVQLNVSFKTVGNETIETSIQQKCAWNQCYDDGQEVPNSCCFLYQEGQWYDAWYDPLNPQVAFFRKIHSDNDSWREATTMIALICILFGAGPIFYWLYLLVAYYRIHLAETRRSLCTCCFPCLRKSSFEDDGQFVPLEETELASFELEDSVLLSGKSK